MLKNLEKIVESCNDPTLKEEALKELNFIKNKSENCKTLLHDISQPMQLVVTILSLPVADIPPHLELLAKNKDNIVNLFKNLKINIKDIDDNISKA